MNKLTPILVSIAAASLTACVAEPPPDRAAEVTSVVTTPCAMPSLDVPRISTTRKIGPLRGVGTGGPILVGANLWEALNDNDMLDVPLDVAVGEQIDQVGAFIFVGTTGVAPLQPIVMSLYRQDSVTSSPTVIGETDIGPNFVVEQPGTQEITINHPAGPGQTVESVTLGLQTYWVHFRYNLPPVSVIKSQSLVGAILLTTSVPAPAGTPPPNC